MKSITGTCLVRLFGEQIYKKVLIIGVLRIGNFDNYYRLHMPWPPLTGLFGGHFGAGWGYEALRIKGNDIAVDPAME